MSRLALARIATGALISLSGLALLLLVFALTMVGHAPAGRESEAALGVLMFIATWGAVPTLLVISGLLLIAKVFRDYHNDIS